MRRVNISRAVYRAAKCTNVGNLKAEQRCKGGVLHQCRRYNGERLLVGFEFEGVKGVVYAMRVRVVRCARARVKRSLDQSVDVESLLLRCGKDCRHNAPLAAPSNTAVAQARHESTRREWKKYTA